MAQVATTRLGSVCYNCKMGRMEELADSFFCPICKTVRPKTDLHAGKFLNSPVLTVSGDPFKRLGLMSAPWWLAFAALTALMVLAEVAGAPMVVWPAFASAFAVYVYKGVRQVEGLFLGR